MCTKKNCSAHGVFACNGTVCRLCPNASLRVYNSTGSYVMDINRNNTRCLCVCLKRFLVRRECKSESLQLHGQLHHFGLFLITAYGHYLREVKALNGNILFCTTTIYILSLPLHIHETTVITFEWLIILLWWQRKLVTMQDGIIVSYQKPLRYHCIAVNAP